MLTGTNISNVTNLQQNSNHHIRGPPNTSHYSSSFVLSAPNTFYDNQSPYGRGGGSSGGHCGGRGGRGGACPLIGPRSFDKLKVEFLPVRPRC